MEEWMEILPQLPDVLLSWFYQNRRELPWRKDKDPYHIWISEIMLQQTRVEAVKGYYSRFLERLPTVASLAKADDELLTKLWEGLGYYTRVRNLKKAALTIMEQHGGIFPNTYEDIRKLSGIGDYTAGAICSIAFGQKVPAVDGNVLRVYSRLTDDHTAIDQLSMKRKVSQQLRLVYPDSAGDFTQAIMELGATVCGPNRKPDCANCPCGRFCLAHKRNTAESLPVKNPKKERKTEDMTVFILNCDDQYALEKRPSSGLLSDLWQFPNTPGILDTEDVIAHLECKGVKVKDMHRMLERNHIFTHIQWNMRGYYIQCFNQGGGYSWQSAKQINEESSLPTAFRQFWEENRLS